MFNSIKTQKTFILGLVLILLILLRFNLIGAVSSDVGGGIGIDITITPPEDFDDGGEEDNNQTDQDTDNQNKYKSPVRILTPLSTVSTNSQEDISLEDNVLELNKIEKFSKINTKITKIMVTINMILFAILLISLLILKKNYSVVKKNISKKIYN